MKFLCKLIISLLPFPLAILVLVKAPHGWVWSIAISCLAFFVWQRLSAWQGIAGPRLGSPLGLLRGVCIGIALTLCAIIARDIAGGYPLKFHPCSLNLPARLASEARPACIEETFLRGGNVHFLAGFFGTGWGYLGGSILFGLGHIFNPQFTFTDFLCASSAGFLFSVMYFEYGLLASIGVHLTWNILSRYLTFAMHWNGLGGMPANIESVWTTTFINLIATFAIIVISRRRKLNQKTN